jgi:hypothetical protein
MESDIYKNMLKALNCELKFFSFYDVVEEKKDDIHVTNYVKVVFVRVHTI